MCTLGENYSDKQNFKRSGLQLCMEICVCVCVCVCLLVHMQDRDIKRERESIYLSIKWDSHMCTCQHIINIFDFPFFAFFASITFIPLLHTSSKCPVCTCLGTTVYWSNWPKMLIVSILPLYVCNTLYVYLSSVLEMYSYLQYSTHSSTSWTVWCVVSHKITKMCEKKAVPYLSI